MDYTPLITAEAQAQGVDPALALAVANRESGRWWSSASIPTGAAGEIGVFQLMPATAAALGVNPYDVSQNIRGGVAYLKAMFAAFGDWCLAVAAYNCGPRCVQDYLAGARSLPASTVDYTSAVLGCSLSSRIQTSAPTAVPGPGPEVVPAGNYVVDDNSAGATDQPSAPPLSLIVFGVLFAGAGLLWYAGE